MSRVHLGWWMAMAWAWAGEVRGQDAAPVDANQLSLDPTGTGLLTTGNGTVIDRGLIHIHGVFHHLERPIVGVPVLGTMDDRVEQVGRREQLDLTVSGGIWKNLQLSARLPLVLSQPATTVRLFEPGDLPVSRGWADPELGIHASVLDGSVYPVQVGVSLPVTIPLGPDDQWMSHGGWTVEPRAVVSTLHGPIRFAGRLGFRIQPRADLIQYQTGQKLRSAAGVHWWINDENRTALEVVADLDLFSPATEQLTRWERQSVESLLGYSRQLTDQWALTAGLGLGLGTGLPTPAWRSLLSVSWTRQAIEIDPCKNIPEGQAIPLECPDPIRDDLDQDGILNADDECPTSPEDFDGLQDEDGCPERDADSDKILDPDDICPLEPETYDGVRDEDGCPDDQLVALTRTSVVQLQRVTFDFAKSSLKPESEPVMWAVLKLLQDHPSLVLRVEGHTDNVGSQAFNEALSVARAQACRDWLVGHAENPDDISNRVRVAGLGESKPTDTNRTNAGMAENRRVEFVVDSLDEGAGIPLFRALEEVDSLPWMTPTEEE